MFKETYIIYLLKLIMNRLIIELFFDFKFQSLINFVHLNDK